MHRQPGYAVIPFDEMYKTSRRPIYIECRGDSVILQPEGIMFGPQDFLGPGGPSNPLASALRAAQEYWRNAPRPAPDMPNEPYPLLLVRPDGIIGYYLVRDAMSSWDAEFGYELVGEDWKLEFPNPVDPQLQEKENRAVAERASNCGGWRKSVRNCFRENRAKWSITFLHFVAALCATVVRRWAAIHLPTIRWVDSAEMVWQIRQCLG